MTTYRVGNHHGTTVVREGDGHVCGREDHDCARGHLVAVATRDDWELAEQIAERLNWPTPDVTHTNGAREALALIRRMLGGDAIQPAGDAMLRAAAAELGLDDDAPADVEPYIETVSAETVASVLAIVDAPYREGLTVRLEDDDEDAPPAPKPWECKLAREHNPHTDPCDCRVSQFCAMGHSLDDAPPAPLSTPETAQTVHVEGIGYPEPPEPLRDRVRPIKPPRGRETVRPAPPSLGPGCICNDPPPTTTGKNTPATRPAGWACPRHGAVI